jgi:signal transduction histidine kinase
MYKHDFMKSRPREDSDVDGPGSQRRLIRDEDDGDTNFVGRTQSLGRRPERRLVHVASLLRALQSAEGLERQIEIVIETDEALMVAADPLLLTAAVGNLVYNAVTFSRDRGRVILRSRAVAEGISIEVEDECEGLHSGDPAALFSPLVCDHHREVASLWLAAAKRTAKALNGTLYVEHEVGVGCTFCLILPHAGHRAQPHGSYTARRP